MSTISISRVGLRLGHHSSVKISISMAVEAVGAEVLEKLKDLLIHDSIAFDIVIDRIEEIRIQLRRMRGFLIDAELRDDSKAVVDWATEYLRILFLAEDKIETYVLSLAASGRRNIGFFQRRGFTLFAAVIDRCGQGNRLRRELRHLADAIGRLTSDRPGEVVDASIRAGSPNSEPEDITSSALVRSVSDKLHVDAPAKKSINGFETFPLNRQSYLLFESLYSPSRTSRSPRSSPGRHRKLRTSYPDQEGPTAIGFTRSPRLFVDKLKRSGGGVIPLVGLTGSGKTTLVHTIYNRCDIKMHFNCRAWVHAPDEFITISQLLPNLLQQVLKSKEGRTPNLGQVLNSSVHEALKDKTYLVVLDHVSMVELWDKLKSAFPDLDTGNSKVIIITRDHDVANQISKQENCQNPHILDKLSNDDSWDLFTKESHLDEGSSGQIKDGFKNKILSKCNGCPLEIILLGGLLSTKGPSYDDWEWYLGQSSCHKMKILPLSYNDLPAHSKLCLLYMALFPNEADISVRRLLRLWLAEGFVRQSPGMSEEDTVEDCFDDLVRRNLIKISKLRSDGSSRKCRLPRALREFLSPKAHQISLFYIHSDHHESVSSASKSSKEEGVSNLPIRRIIEYADIKSYNPAPNTSLLPSYKNLRSYLSFNSQRYDTPAKEVGSFLTKIIGNRRFGMLRVLDLEGVYKPTLPKTLKQLFHLRYLGLRWTFIDNLPKSVGDLHYLETLDLKRTYINSLPSSIWQLKRLRHLNLPDIRLDYKQKNGHNSLTELRTLVGLIVADQAAVSELSQLCELRELDITCQLSFSESFYKDLMSWIQKLTQLRFLGLKSKDKMGRPSKIKWEPPLSNLSDLSHLSLLGNLEPQPTSEMFPPNLKVLSLSVSRLTVDPMPVLSKLPSLSVLRLLADSYLGTNMKCPKNKFKSLRVLKLWMLENLTEWTVEEECMPHLKELNIRNCSKLKQLPSRLLDQDTLEELTLTTMPMEFIEQVKQKKQGHPNTILTLNDFNFTPLPWENDPGLWSDMEVDRNTDDVADCV